MPKEENLESAAVEQQKSSWKDRIKKIGFIGFLFFTIKGLLWLIIPYLIATYFSG